MSIEKIRKTGCLILIGVFGMVVIQLAAPVILGILVQGAALAVPLAVYHFFVKEKWRVKLVRENENAYGNRKADHKVNHESEEKSKETGQKENLFDDNRNPFGEYGDLEAEMSEEDMVKDDWTAAWYEEQGKDKILGIVMKLMKREIGEFWIRKDGICNIRTGKGYRRTGTIPGFFETDKKRLIQLLEDDGIVAVDQGKYLHVTWVR